MLDLLSSSSLTGLLMFVRGLENGKSNKELGRRLRSWSTELKASLLTGGELWFPACSGLPNSSTKSIFTGP